MLAEDNDADVFLFKEALRTSAVNFELERYVDGEACIRSLAAHAAPLPEIIVLDLNMPKVGGFEVLRTVRADLRFDGVPVVIVTSSSSVSERLKALSLGANAFIVKSMRLRDFLMTVGASVKALLHQSERAAKP